MEVSKFQKDILNYIKCIGEDDLRIAFESESSIYTIDNKKYIVIEITELKEKYHEDAHIVFYYHENETLQIVNNFSEVEKVLLLYELHQKELNK